MSWHKKCLHWCVGTVRLMEIYTVFRPDCEWGMMGMGEIGMGYRNRAGPSTCYANAKRAVGRRPGRQEANR